MVAWSITRLRLNTTYHLAKYATLLSCMMQLFALGGFSEYKGGLLGIPLQLHTLYLPSSNPLACATYPLLPHVSSFSVYACVYVTPRTLDLNSCGRVLLFSCPWHVKFVVQEALMRPLV